MQVIPLIRLHFVQVKLWSHFKPPSRILPNHYTPGALIGQTDSGRPITGNFTYRSSSLLYFISRQFKQHLLQIYSRLCLNNDLRQNSDKILVKLHTYLFKNDTWTKEEVQPAAPPTSWPCFLKQTKTWLGLEYSKIQL